MDLLQCLEMNLECGSGYDPNDVHDFDFQSFDDVVEWDINREELGWSVGDSPNCKWKATKKFPYVYKRKTDNKKAWCNKKGSTEINKTKRFTFVKFDGTLATKAQKDQWNKDMKAVAQAFGPAPITTGVPFPGTSWTKKQQMPYFFKRISDNKSLWANRKGFDQVVKTKKYKFIRFDNALATAAQKKDWAELGKLLAKLGPAPPPAPKKAPAPPPPLKKKPAPSPTPPKQPLALPHPDTKWMPTKNYPWAFKRISDGKGIHAGKKGFDYLVKTKKYKFLKFKPELATAKQKQQWAELSKALARLGPAPAPPPPKKAPLPTPPKTVSPETAEQIALQAEAQGPLVLPHPDTKWMPTKNYPWAFNRISDGKGIHAGKDGFDFLVKTKQYKFKKFKPELATPLQKQQWAELSKALARLAPAPAPAKTGIVAGAPFATPSGGMAKDILDIKRMLQLQELQRQATHEHEEIADTDQFRREVLTRLTRIAEAILAPNHPTRLAIQRAR